MCTKISIDRDTRTLLLKYVKKYGEYARWYQEERERLLDPSRRAPDGMPKGSGKGDPTMAAAERLEWLESQHRTRVVHAVEKAREHIGEDFCGEAKESIRRAIWLSCQDGGTYNFEAFAGAVACERRQFYYYKNQFLNEIRVELGI